MLSGLASNKKKGKDRHRKLSTDFHIYTIAQAHIHREIKNKVKDTERKEKGMNGGREKKGGSRVRLGTKEGKG